jgi:hypothetical protein
LHRQVEVLRETFPKVAAALGDDGFFALAQSYVRAHPPEHADLGRLGRRFADFVQRPDLRDLARLEWARSEVAEAADCEPLSSARFADRARDARIRLVPALRLLELEHDVSALWDETSRSGPPLAKSLVVWRSGFDVFHVAVADDEAAALRLAASGATLGEARGAFSDPERSAEALQGWIAAGWIAS